MVGVQEHTSPQRDAEWRIEMGTDINKYLRRRNEKFFLPIREQALEADGFEVEGKAHPHAVLRAMSTGEMAVIKEKFDGETAGMALLACCVERWGGDWVHYDGPTHKTPSWPGLEEDFERALAQRVQAIQRLAVPDLMELQERAASKQEIRVGEKKPSATP